MALQLQPHDPAALTIARIEGMFEQSVHGVPMQFLQVRGAGRAEDPGVFSGSKYSDW